MEETPLNKNIFLNKSRNLARKASEWKQIAYFEALVIMGLIFFLIYQSSTVPVRLVPQMNPNQVFLTKEGTSVGEYLRIISEADMGSYLDYTPDTIERQWNNLIGRLASNSYGKIRQNLKEGIEQQIVDGVSQTFTQKGVAVAYGKKVFVMGRLVRRVGSEEIANDMAYYVTEYTYKSGVPMIMGIKRFEDEKAARNFAKIK